MTIGQLNLKAFLQLSFMGMDFRPLFPLSRLLEGKPLS